jgi:DNA-binding CsgD family transcriptional regulator
MSKVMTRGGERTALASYEGGTDPHNLIRAFLNVAESLIEQRSVNATNVDPANGDSERVLLDIDFEGARYLLIKMPVADRKCTPLSPRELEIVRMVAQGHPNKVIAVVLNISSWTVCTHLRRIFAKLGVSSRAAMGARVTEFAGLVPQNAGLDYTVVRSDTNWCTSEPATSYLEDRITQRL